MFYKMLVKSLIFFCMVYGLRSVDKTDVKTLIQQNMGIPAAVVPKLENMGIPVLKSMYSLLTKEGRENALSIMNQRCISAKTKVERYFENSKSLRSSTEQEISSLEASLATSNEPETQYIKDKILLHNERLTKMIEKGEVFKAIFNTFELHREFLNANLEMRTEEQTGDSEKSFYIEDLEVVEAQIISMNAKTNSLKLKKEKSNKQLASYQGRKIERKKESDKIEQELRILKSDKSEKDKGSNKSSKANYSLSRKQESLLLDLKKDLNKLDEEWCELKIKQVAAEMGLLDDEKTILEIKKRDLESKIVIIKQRLFVSGQDIEKLATEIESHRKKSQKNKNKLKNTLIEKQRLKLKDEEKVESINKKLRATAIPSLNTSGKVVSYLNLLIDLIKCKKELVLAENEILKLQFQDDLEEAKEYELLFKLKNAQFYVGTKDQDFELVELAESLSRDLETISGKIKEFETELLFDSGLAHITFEIAECRSTVASIEKLSADQNINSKEIKDAMESFEEIVADLSLNLSPNTTSGYKGYGDECLDKYKTLQQKYLDVYREVKESLGERHTWTRSSRAISVNDLLISWANTKNLTYELFYAVDKLFTYENIKRLSKTVSVNLLLLFLLLLLFISILFFAIKRALHATLKLIERKQAENHNNQFTALSALLVKFLYQNHFLIYPWLVFLIIIKAQYILGFRAISMPLEAMFYVATVPLLVKLLFDFFSFFKTNFSWDSISSDPNWTIFKLDHFSKSDILVTSLFYAGAVILPLKSAAMVYQTSFPSKLPEVLLAAYTLFAELAVFFFLSKDDWLTIIPETPGPSSWFKQFLNKYYYAIFFYIMTIAVLHNPYIGYFNLARKILIWAPISVTIVYGMWFINEFLRKMMLSIFVVEEEDSVVERFENGRMLYACIVIVSFIAMIFSGFFILSKIWGFSYSFEHVMACIKSEWVFKMETGETFGLIQLSKGLLCFLGGFIASSVFNRFVMTKLFDAFNAELGFQNTVQRLTYYCIIFISLIVALITMGLQSYMPMTLGVFLLGIGIALRDLLSDVFGGIFILLERQFEIGHVVELESEKILGTVQKISFRSTVIRTARNFFIAVPNRIMISKPVTNWGMMRFAVGAEITVRVNFDQDPKKIQELIFKAIDQCPGIMRIPAPVVRLDGFFDSGMVFYARAFFSGKRVREMFGVCSDLRVAIIVIFQKNGIKMPYPQKTVRVLDKRTTETNEKEVDIAKTDEPIDEDPFIKINLIKPGADGK